MQIIHLVIVELTSQSLQNHVMGCWLWQKILLIGRTKILFPLIYKQSVLTSSGCYVTIPEMVTVNKYDQFISNRWNTSGKIKYMGSHLQRIQWHRAPALSGEEILSLPSISFTSSSVVWTLILCLTSNRSLETQIYLHCCKEYCRKDVCPVGRRQVIDEGINLCYHNLTVFLKFLCYFLDRKEKN